MNESNLGKGQLQQQSKKYKYFSEWEEFVQNNKSVINKHVVAIKNRVNTISDEKRRKKYYKNEMHDYRTTLIQIWDYMKKLELREIIRKEVIEEINLSQTFGSFLGRIEGKKLRRDKTYLQAKAKFEAAVEKLQQRIDAFDATKFRDE